MQIKIIKLAITMRAIDLLIIGSGPAGISTALHLLNRDPSWVERMIVVDKAVHPRPKLCGGGVTRTGFKTLRELDFQLPLPIPAVAIEDARLLYKGRVIHVRGKPVIVIFNRIELDAYLAQVARKRGVVIQEGEAVQKMKFESGVVEVETSRDNYRVKAVVGADGSTGITRRLLNRKGSRSRVARVIEGVFPARLTDNPFIDRFVLFDFNPLQEGLQGYFWDFPARVAGKPCFNRGVFDSRFVAGEKRAGLPAIFKRGAENLDGVEKPVNIQGNPIHWFSPDNDFAVPHLLLVGDAAGVDPLLGEGISHALGYGKVASEALIAAFERGDFSFDDYRRRVLRSGVGRSLLFRWSLASIAYHLSLNSAFMHTIWTAGQLITAFWSPEISKYRTSSRKQDSEFEGHERHYAN